MCVIEFGPTELLGNQSLSFPLDGNTYIIGQSLLVKRLWIEMLQASLDYGRLILLDSGDWSYTIQEYSKKWSAKSI